MALDQILLPALAVVGGFLVVVIASRLFSKPNRQTFSQAVQSALPAAREIDPLASLADVIDAQRKRAVVERWVSTHVDTLVDRDTRDIAAGYAPVSSMPANPGAPRPNP